MLNPIRINIRSFVKSGKFASIKLGQTKEEIESQNFAPDNWLSLNNEAKENSPIWVYDFFQFIFDESNKLIRLNMNYVSDTRHEKGKFIISEDWWIIPPGKKVSLIDTLSELNTMNLDFEKKYIIPGFVDIQLPNGVYMSFDHPEECKNTNQNEWTMSVLGKRIID